MDNTTSTIPPNRPSVTTTCLSVNMLGESPYHDQPPKSFPTISKLAVPYPYHSLGSLPHPRRLETCSALPGVLSAPNARPPSHGTLIDLQVRPSFLPRRCHERIPCCRPGFSSQGYSTQNHSNLSLIDCNSAGLDEKACATVSEAFLAGTNQQQHFMSMPLPAVLRLFRHGRR